MNTLSYTALRTNLAKTMEQICADHAPIIITRGKRQAAVVIISLEDYQSLQETHYLLRSPKNASRLSDAISEIETQFIEKKKK